MEPSIYIINVRLPEMAMFEPLLFVVVIFVFYKMLLWFIGIFRG